MPLFGKRAFTLRIPGGPTGGPFGENQLVYHDEYIATEIGQVGTQFDGLGHIGIQLGEPGDKAEMRCYNGSRGRDFSDAYGLKKLGVENCKPLFTRGHLVDMVGGEGPHDGGRRGDQRRRSASRVAKQNMPESDIKPGDAIFFNTGWGPLWKKNNDKFNSGEPGIGLEIANWVDRQGSLPDRRRYLGGRSGPNPRQEPGVRRAQSSCRPSTASSITRTWSSTS